MKLLVTGNGFDLAHGLPVKYTDMLDALFDPTLYKKNHPTYSLDWLKPEDKNRFCGVPLLKHFKTRRNLSGWAGFENELQEIITYFISAERHGVHMGGNNIRGDYSAYEYPELESIIDFHARNDTDLMWTALSDQLNQVCEFIALYICNLKMDFNSVPNKQALKPIYTESYTFYLTFNYSKTFELNYDTAAKDFSVTNQPRFFSMKSYSQFIHGDADTPSIPIYNSISLSPLVLGIHNDLSRVNPNDVDAIHRLVFDKSFQRIQKHTGSQYRQWFNAPLHYGQKAPISTDIYGHSMDVADHDVLKYIIEKSATTKIYYLNQSDYEQKIINLVKMYGSMTEVEDRFYSEKITLEQIPT